MNKFLELYYRLNAFLHYKYFQKVKRFRYLKRRELSFDPDFSLAIPKEKILFLHVGLKELKMITNKSYKDLTCELVKILEKTFEPSAIVVPTFTWSFIQSGIYSVNYSKSETGVFSDIFRSIADYRTPNAIQNFSIKSNEIETYRKLNHQNTFSKDGIYEFFRQNETYIIDINTDTFRASPLHHIEIVCNLPYLYTDKIEFKGTLFDQNDIPHETIQSHGGTYIYDKPYIFNKEKIHNFLKNMGALKSLNYKNINISQLSNQDMHKLLETKLQTNPYFAITI